MSFFQKLIDKLAGNSPAQAPPAPTPTTVADEEATLQSAPITTPVATAPLSSDMLIEDSEHINPQQFVVGCGHSVGLQRDHNEDALFTLTTTMVCNSTQVPFGLYIVADGMGGHQHGEIASSLAVRSISNYVVRKLYEPLYGSSQEIPEESIQEILQDAVCEAHQAIIKEAVGGGTTLTAAVLMGKQLTIAHVGDSRAYALYPDNTIKALTRDHSLVRRLEELGQITSAEAAVHPQRNVLYRALGQGEPFDPDIYTFPQPQSGYLILCSDGLWGIVPEKELIEIINKAPNLEMACHRLVNAANAAGGPDNISVILVRIPI